MGLLSKLSEKRMKDPVGGTVKVVSISMPDPEATMSVYRMDCVVSGPGIEPKALVHKGMASLAKWPRQGADLPAVIDRADATRFIVKWDEITDWRQTSKERAEAVATDMQAVQDGSTADMSDAERVPMLVRYGTLGEAVILAVRDTGTTGPYASHELELDLDVSLPGEEPYHATARQLIGPMAMSKFAVGARIRAHVDPHDGSNLAVSA